MRGERERERERERGIISSQKKEEENDAAQQNEAEKCAGAGTTKSNLTKEESVLATWREREREIWSKKMNSAQKERLCMFVG